MHLLHFMHQCNNIEHFEREITKLETNVFSIDKFSERLRELRGEKTLQEVADGVL